jgi:choline dehydrogenase-like flavoprotein
MGWSYQEIPRAAPGCMHTNACAQGCPTGAKSGMSRSVLPAAERAGARVLPGVRVIQLLRKKGRVVGVVARRRQRDGAVDLVRLEAEHVFVCAGPTETPALLLRSGIKYHVGNTLRVHPYLKVAARFDEIVDAHRQVLPLLQVKEFWPELSLGGAFFSLGQLALTLSENWPENRHAMREHRKMAHYYVGVRGTGRGWVRPSLFGTDATMVRYELSDDDATRLSIGLARLSELLLAAGAKEVYPSVSGLPVIRSEAEAVRWLDEVLPKSRLGLVTVHAFSSCPAGERRDLCAADSFGRVLSLENLYVNDASMLPDSPGVNPQGTIMALARRNAQAFADRQ